MDPRQPAREVAPARVAVFARWPAPGRVKTRLSPALPPELACALHAALVSDTLAVAAAAGADETRVLWADAPGPAPPSPGGIAIPPGVRAGVQSGGPLGERLTAAFDALLADDARAVVVGSDCPGLRPLHLRAAFDALRDHDLVLGPAADGGYWLIGLRAPAPRLFEGIAWGTGSVREQTLARAARDGLRVAQLATLADLDTPHDLAALVAGGLADPAAVPPATRAALARMGLLAGTRLAAY